MQLKSLQATAKPIKRAELSCLDGTRVLFSYGEPVAAHLHGRRFLRIDKPVSKTTELHISEWINGADAECVKADEISRVLECKVVAK